MKNILLFVVFVPFISFAQVSYPPAKSVLSNIYAQLIAEYIHDVKKIDKLTFDTLFIGKHEELPDITLPKTIAGKTINLLTYHDGDTVPQNRKRFKLINIIEWKITDSLWTYMLVTFHKDYRPQHNCFIDIHYDPRKRQIKRVNKIRYEFSYPARKE